MRDNEIWILCCTTHIVLSAIIFVSVTVLFLDIFENRPSHGVLGLTENKTTDYCHFAVAVWIMLSHNGKKRLPTTRELEVRRNDTHLLLMDRRHKKKKKTDFDFHARENLVPQLVRKLWCGLGERGLGLVSRTAAFPNFVLFGDDSLFLAFFWPGEELNILLDLNLK